MLVSTLEQKVAQSDKIIQDLQHQVQLLTNPKPEPTSNSGSQSPAVQPKVAVQPLKQSPQVAPKVQPTPSNTLGTLRSRVTSFTIVSWIESPIESQCIIVDILLGAKSPEPEPIRKQSFSGNPDDEPFTESERQLFTSWINEKLAGDIHVGAKLPAKIDTLQNLAADGVS
jgi:hypothetical protein